MKHSKLIKTATYITLIIVLALPSLIMALYSYPVQDDFHYAYYGRKLMEEGHSLFSMAMAKTIEYYKTFCGCYTSTFLGYFFSGIINCDIWGIRIYEVLSGIFFYYTLFCFVKALVCDIMKQETKHSLNIYVLILACFNCLMYYSEHEDFYWFITSVQYLTISSCILLGASHFAKAILTCKSRYVVSATALGFLGSGGALNIAAFCCVTYLLVGLWAIFDQGKMKETIIIFGVTLIGAIINGIAPGNFIRKGKSVGISGAIEAIELSLKYAYERSVVHLNKPLFIAILICLIICVMMWERKNYHYQFRCPVTFTFIMFGCVAVVIFPVMIGYGWNTYQIICRGNFISDMAIYLFGIMAVAYWRGWITQTFEEHHLGLKTKKIIYAIIAVVMCILVIRVKWIEVPLVRGVRDIVSGECKRYSNFCVGVYDMIAQSEEEEVTLMINRVEDITCMITPQFYYGYYDYEKEYANRTIARFYNKKVVYLIDVENPDTTGL